MSVSPSQLSPVPDARLSEHLSLESKALEPISGNFGSRILQQIKNEFNLIVHIFKSGLLLDMVKSGTIRTEERVFKQLDQEIKNLSDLMHQEQAKIDRNDATSIKNDQELRSKINETTKQMNKLILYIESRKPNEELKSNFVRLHQELMALRKENQQEIKKDNKALQELETIARQALNPEPLKEVSENKKADRIVKPVAKPTSETAETARDVASTVKEKLPAPPPATRHESGALVVSPKRMRAPKEPAISPQEQLHSDILDQYKTVLQWIQGDPKLKTEASQTLALLEQGRAKGFKQMETSELVQTLKSAISQLKTEHRNKLPPLFEAQLQKAEALVNKFEGKEVSSEKAKSAPETPPQSLRSIIRDRLEEGEISQRKETKIHAALAEGYKKIVEYIRHSPELSQSAPKALAILGDLSDAELQEMSSLEIAVLLNEAHKQFWSEISLSLHLIKKFERDMQSLQDKSVTSWARLREPQVEREWVVSRKEAPETLSLEHVHVKKEAPEPPMRRQLINEYRRVLEYISGNTELRTAVPNTLKILEQIKPPIRAINTTKFAEVLKEACKEFRREYGKKLPEVFETELQKAESIVAEFEGTEREVAFADLRESKAELDKTLQPKIDKIKEREQSRKDITDGLVDMLAKIKVQGEQHLEANERILVNMTRAHFNEMSEEKFIELAKETADNALRMLPESVKENSKEFQEIDRLRTEIERKIVARGVSDTPVVTAPAKQSKATAREAALAELRKAKADLDVKIQPKIDKLKQTRKDITDRLVNILAEIKSLGAMHIEAKDRKLINMTHTDFNELSEDKFIELAKDVADTATNYVPVGAKEYREIYEIESKLLARGAYGPPKLKLTPAGLASPSKPTKQPRLPQELKERHENARQAVVSSLPRVINLILKEGGVRLPIKLAKNGVELGKFTTNDVQKLSDENLSLLVGNLDGVLELIDDQHKYWKIESEVKALKTLHSMFAETGQATRSQKIQKDNLAHDLRETIALAYENGMLEKSLGSGWGSVPLPKFLGGGAGRSNDNKALRGIESAKLENLPPHELAKTTLEALDLIEKGYEQAHRWSQEEGEFGAVSFKTEDTKMPQKLVKQIATLREQLKPFEKSRAKEFIVENLPRFLDMAKKAGADAKYPVFALKPEDFKKLSEEKLVEYARAATESIYHGTNYKQRSEAFSAVNDALQKNLFLMGGYGPPGEAMLPRSKGTAKAETLSKPVQEQREAAKQILINQLPEIVDRALEFGGDSFLISLARTKKEVHSITKSDLEKLSHEELSELAKNLVRNLSYNLPYTDECRAIRQELYEIEHQLRLYGGYGPGTKIPDILSAKPTQKAKAPSLSREIKEERELAQRRIANTLPQLIDQVIDLNDNSVFVALAKQQIELKPITLYELIKLPKENQNELGVLLTDALHRSLPAQLISVSENDPKKTYNAANAKARQLIAKLENDLRIVGAYEPASKLDDLIYWAKYDPDLPKTFKRDEVSSKLFELIKYAKDVGDDSFLTEMAKRKIDLDAIKPERLAKLSDKELKAVAKGICWAVRDSSTIKKLSDKAELIEPFFK